MDKPNGAQSSRSSLPLVSAGAVGRGLYVNLSSRAISRFCQNTRPGLFGSVRRPGNAILGAYDSARKLRDEVRPLSADFTLLSKRNACGFCCEEGSRLLSASLGLSAKSGFRRIGAELLNPAVCWYFRLLKNIPGVRTKTPRYRNECVAALSDEVLIIHATPGGEIERIPPLP